MKWDYLQPVKIYFGKGRVQEIKKIAQELGCARGLLVAGPFFFKSGLAEKIMKESEGMLVASFGDVSPNPDVTEVDACAEIIRQNDIGFVVALGGGSPMDVAKAVGVLARYGGSITEYEGAHLVPGPIEPIIAIPTTAGTGSEVTAFSVITDTSRNYKLTVFSYELLPKYALLDPEMIVSVPPMVAASCGIDALIHAWEAYTSLGASPFSDAMAEKAMELIGGNIRRFVANRKDEEAACAMMSGSMFAGIAFAWARLGDVHAMSHPVSAFFGVQHGVANSILLPVIVEYNALADHGRYEKIYNYISEDKEPVKDFKPEMLVAEIKKLNASLGIPKTLSEVGVTEDKIPQMAVDAMKSGNIAANPRQTTLKDVEMLYRKAL